MMPSSPLNISDSKYTSLSASIYIYIYASHISRAVGGELGAQFIDIPVLQLGSASDLAAFGHKATLQVPRYVYKWNLEKNMMLSSCKIQITRYAVQKFQMQVVH